MVRFCPRRNCENVTICGISLLLTYIMFMSLILPDKIPSKKSYYISKMKHARLYEHGSFSRENVVHDKNITEDATLRNHTEKSVERRPYRPLTDAAPIGYPSTGVGMKVNFSSTTRIDLTKVLYGNLERPLIAKRFLTIGLVSVRREGISYLEETLDSIINGITQEDKTRIIVVILIADREQEVVIARAKELSTVYSSFIKSGFISIIQADKGIYPKFSTLKQNLNDSKERVEWRSKQNVDYSYIFSFCHRLSEYYLHLEDDVKAIPNFFSEIKAFLRKVKRKKWFVLYFSKIGFIGKFFKCKDLRDFAEYLLDHFNDLPCDLLLNQYRLLKDQPKIFIRVPTLFQHNGVVSSLQGKKQLIIDPLFKGNGDFLAIRKKFYLQNPLAEVYTTMNAAMNTLPSSAYGQHNKVFVVHNVSKGDSITVKFKHPQNVSRIYIGSGIGKFGENHFPNGDVYVSQNRSSETNCTTNYIGFFLNGVFDILNSTRIPESIKCLSVVATNNINTYVTFREIAVFTSFNTVS